jgi:hypothetical protein
VCLKFSSINFCPWKLKTDFWNCDNDELEKLRCSKKKPIPYLGRTGFDSQSERLVYLSIWAPIIFSSFHKMLERCLEIFRVYLNEKCYEYLCKIFGIVAVCLSYSAYSLVGGYQRNHNINFYCSENLIWAVSNHHPTRCRNAEDDDMNHPSNNKYHIICLKLLTGPVVLSKERIRCKPYRRRYFDLLSLAYLLGRACSTNGGEEESV